MIIQQLLNGRQRSNFIIIEDNINFSGNSLIRRFIHENVSRQKPVHVCLTEKDETSYNTTLSGIHFHKLDCFSWPEDNVKTRRLEDVLYDLKTRCMEEGSSALVVLDSLWNVLHASPLDSLCRCFRDLSQPVAPNRWSIQLIVCLHKELMPVESQSYIQMDYLASSVIRLDSDMEEKQTRIQVEHRRPTGKIIKEMYNVSCGAHDMIQFDKVDTNKKHGEVVGQEESGLVTTTFKLTLEEREKESRNKVVLPYIRTNAGAAAKGRIFYEPDANDDWDDEDPDDDLEI